MRLLRPFVPLVLLIGSALVACGQRDAPASDPAAPASPPSSAAQRGSFGGGAPKAPASAASAAH